MFENNTDVRCSVVCLLTTLVTVALSLSASWAADWPTHRNDNRRSGVTTETLPFETLEQKWVIRAPHVPRSAWPAPARWDSYANVRGLSEMRNYDPCFHVTVQGTTLYYGSSADDSVHAVDTQTGQEKWAFTTDAPVRVAPTVSGERLYFGSDDGHAYCISANDGQLIWRSESPKTAERFLNNGRLISLWACRTGVMIEGEIAYFGMGLFPWEEAYLCAVDALTGKVVGDQHYQKPHFGLTMEGALLSTGDRIVAPAGRVPPYLFTRVNGNHAGAMEGSGGSFVVADEGDHLFYGPGNKTGWMLEGETVSKKQLSIYRGKKGVAVVGDRLYFIDPVGVSCVERKSQKVVWATEVEKPLELIVVGDAVVVGGTDYVAAVGLDDGKLRWKSPIDGKGYGLAAAGGALFVSTNEGVIHCFRSDDVTADKTAAKVTPTNDVNKQANDSSQGDAEQSAAAKKKAKAGLINHWVFHHGMSANAKRRGLTQSHRRVGDDAGQTFPVIQGIMQLREAGGYEALELDGQTSSVLISTESKDFSKLEKTLLPREQLSVCTWVRVDEPDSIGGVVSAFQDTKELKQGWILGFHHSRFVFGLAAKAGGAGITYLPGKTEIKPGHWYHVAATYDGKSQKLYVNGQFDAESSAQQGEIDYPKSGFYEMGAYHDDNDDTHMYGMLHEVRVYDRAIQADESMLLYDEKKSAFPTPIDLKIGPYTRFVTPDSAEVRWETDEPTPTIVEHYDGLNVQEFRDDKPKTSHVATITGLKRDRMTHYSIRTVVNGRSDTTLQFELDNYFNFTVPQVKANATDVGSEKNATSVPYAKVAKKMLDRLAAQRGIALMIGCSDGQLAVELAQQSDLRVIGFDTDLQVVQKLRKRLLTLGIYGGRIAVHHVPSYDKLPVVGRFANLIVSQTTLDRGQLAGNVKEYHRLLRPNGGLIYLGQPAGADKLLEENEFKTWLAQADEKFDVTPSDNGLWAVYQRPALKGSGEWSHLYGKADNSAFGGEALAGASTTGEMQIQWMGRPGPRVQPDRNGRKPSPLAVNGRLFIQGLHRLVCVDSFNGSVLWAFEIPVLERFNMPRDCSNWCADENNVFIAAKNYCWQIDAATGKVVRRFEAAPGSQKDWKFDWGYIARDDQHLIGTGVKAGTAFTSFWGDNGAGWYDARSGPVTFKVCSDSLFAYDMATGKRAWNYQNGVIINSTVTAAGNKVYFVESRHPEVKKSVMRRVGMDELWEQQFLVSLDSKTGEVVWEQPLKVVPGKVAFFLAYGGDRLVLNSSASDKKFYVYAFDAKTGQSKWDNEFGWTEGKGDHGKALSRPAIVNGRVFVRPKVMDLETGKLESLEMPKGKCGTYAATTRSLIFRTGRISIWNTESGSTTSWDRMRPGCWLSTIPASGMLLSPEGGGGCSCGSWMEMSVGFMPK